MINGFASYLSLCPIYELLEIFPDQSVDVSVDATRVHACHMTAIFFFFLFFFFFFFFLAFAGYTIRAAREMNEVFFQFLLAAVEFGRQRSADRPNIFFCSFVKGTSL